VNGVAVTAGIPEEKAPIVKISEGTGATYNDPVLVDRLVVAFKQVLGEENVVKLPPVMGSEDFGNFSLGQKIPTAIFWLGASDPEKVRANRESGAALPGWHSALFAPVP
jgi:hippurate hydrolase